jgi:RNA polymerase sigma-70 factor (ECF subfamily)
MKTTYNKSEIMKRAWVLFRNQEVRTMEMFSYCMKQSWDIAKGIVAPISSIEEIYVKNKVEILTYITFKLRGNREVAEEICDDTFLKAERYMDSYDSTKSKLTTWLKGIANQQIIDHWRGQRNITKVNEIDSYTMEEVTTKVNRKVNVSDYTDNEAKEFFTMVSDNDASADVESNDVSTDIAKAFRSLKPKYRKVAIKFFLRQKSYNEVAEICDIPLNNVKQLIFRSRAMLQTELQRQRDEFALN